MRAFQLELANVLTLLSFRASSGAQPVQLTRPVWGVSDSSPQWYVLELVKEQIVFARREMKGSDGLSSICLFVHNV